MARIIFSPATATTHGRPALTARHRWLFNVMSELCLVLGSNKPEK